MTDLAPASVTFMQPTVGRIVHFFTPDSPEPRAAIILAAQDPSGRYGTSKLEVFGTHEIVENVLYIEKRADDSPNWWAWPPRV